MIKFKHALLLSAAAAAMATHGPASATEWQITSATFGYYDSFWYTVNTPGKPFVDGQFSQKEPWSLAGPWKDAAAFNLSDKTYKNLPSSFAMLDFPAMARSPGYGPWNAPHVDLSSMTADFSSLVFSQGYIDGFRGATYYSPGSITEIAFFGDFLRYDDLPTGVGKLTKNADDSYTYGVYSPYGQVVVNFKSVPDGSAANYVPVPEASTMFMALAGLGALGVLRRRQRA